ncbi:MAG: SpoIIE family protein phosphatase [Bacteroidia bacterium]|nr:SpoIIE family protein phosphatase [Bacteroidia bacterium]
MASLGDLVRRMMGQASQLGLEEMPLDAYLADKMAQFFPIPVFVFDVQRDRISWASPASLLLMGISGRELRRMTPLSLLETYFHPSEPILRLYTERMQEGQYSVHFRSVEGDKPINGLWMGLPTPEGTCSHFLLIFQDVSELEMMKEELIRYASQLQEQIDRADRLASEKEAVMEELIQQSEKIRLLAAATAYSHMMQFILDGQGHIVWVNRMFERASGWPASELVGRRADDVGGTFGYLLPTPETSPTPENSILSHLSRAPFTREIYAYDKQGKGYWMLISIVPIRDELGNTTHYLGSMLNVTKRKEREERLRIYQEELNQSFQYAFRIQSRFLTPVEQLRPFFSVVEVWYAPQMGVGGDFYVAEPIGDQLVLAMGDSTGHGVSAAMLSIYAATVLRQILSHYQGDLERIYAHLVKDIQEVFGGEAPLLDGFELALLSYTSSTRKALYLGARRPLWVVRGGEVYALSGGLQDISVTRNDQQRTPPTLQRLTLQPGDRIYLFSDGLVDQLNMEGKRFSSSRLKAFLQTYSNLTLKEQIAHLREAIRLWASGRTQTDDLLLLAMEIG